MFLHVNSGLRSDWADAKTNMSIRWVHRSFVGFVIGQHIKWKQLIYFEEYSEKQWNFGNTYSKNPINLDTA